MKLIRIIITAVIIIVIFTAADYLGHKFLESNFNLEKVPQNYFTNKIIYGTIILSLVLFFINKFSFTKYSRVFVIAAIVVLGLQFRYYYLYSSKFNYIILFLHYLILAPILYIAQERNLI